MKTTCLLSLSHADLRQLRYLYACNKEHIFIYNTLQNYCNIFKKGNQVGDVKILTLNGRWKETGLFVIQFNNYLHFSTLTSKEHLKEALSLLNLNKNGDLIIFNGFAQEFQDLVDEVVRKCGLWSDVRLNGSYCYYVLPEEDLKRLEKRTLPPGFYLSPLRKSDAYLVNSTWSAKHDNSLKLIEFYIERGTSLGAYTYQGELVAWIMIQLVGAIGLLYVTEPYRKHGFATLLVTKLSLSMHELGFHVAATISDTNLHSQRLFTKLGFRKLQTSRYNWNYLRSSHLEARSI